MNKLQKFLTKIVTFKPQAFKTIESAYKALYVLNAIIEFSVDSATKLGIDVSTIAKIGTYVTKIKGYVNAIASKLGITIDEAFEIEVRALVTEQAIPLPRTAAKRAKLTVGDVVNSQAAAFGKLDELLAD